MKFSDMTRLTVGTVTIIYQLGLAGVTLLCQNLADLPVTLLAENLSVHDENWVLAVLPASSTATIRMFNWASTQFGFITTGTGGDRKRELGDIQARGDIQTRNPPSTFPTCPQGTKPAWEFSIAANVDNAYTFN